MAQQPAPRPTACLALADGSLFYGYGFGAIDETEAIKLVLLAVDQGLYYFDEPR